MDRWRDRFRRRNRSAEIDAEIASHIRMAIEDRIARGESPDDARRRALVEFGNVGRTREEARAVWSWTRVEQLLLDLRSGARILTRSPGISATAITLIALVIGANTTIFSAVHGLLTKPAPGVQPDGLVSLSWSNDRGTVSPEVSYPLFRHLADGSRTMSLVGFSSTQLTMVDGTGAYSLRGETVSPGYFETLGASLASGRRFSPSEDALDASGLVAIISHRLWTEHFDSTRSIVGQPILLNGHSATIVGVAAAGFHGGWLGEATDVWVPMRAYARVSGSTPTLEDPSQTRVEGMLGRLAGNATLAGAQAEMTALAAQFRPQPKPPARLVPVAFEYTGIAGRDNLVAERGPIFLAIFSAVTAVTLIVVCANVANLMLARAFERRREMAVRQSFGATRLRIVRIVLAEGLTLALTAWGAACLFALWMSSLLPGIIPPSEFGNVRVDLDMSPDWTVLGYAMVLAVLATLIFTAAPAVSTWRQDLLSFLKAGEQSVVRGRSGLSRGLVVLQLAFSVVLLTIAGLAFRSLALIDQVDIGFNYDRLLLVTVDTAARAKTTEARAALADAMLERIRTVPGVTTASFARHPPSGGWPQVQVRRPGMADPIMAEHNYAGTGYFEAVGLPPIAGTELSTRPVGIEAVITKGLADALWPGQAAVGQTIIVGSPATQATIAGVVPDAYYSGSRRRARSHFVFMSPREDRLEWGMLTFQVRHAAAIDTVVPAIGRALKDVDAAVPIWHVRTMEQELENVTWIARTLTAMLTAFAAVSLLIAGLGQYAAMAFTMRRRVRDFGIRMALGASPRQILAGALREGLGLTAAGLVLGLALGLAAGRSSRSLLYGVSPADVPTYAGVLVLLGLASVVACYVPARQASRVDPIDALRQE